MIKNALISHKKVKARMSWSCETFNRGRLQLAKVNVRGKTLVLYLALNPADYLDSKYHFTDVSEKARFSKVPMMLKVRSDRGLKYALELIGDMMQKYEIPEGAEQNEDYHLPYETTAELVRRGLVKLLIPAEEMSEEVDSADLRPDENGHYHVSADGADALMTDVEAERRIESIAADGVVSDGNVATISLGSICANFADGDTVNLDALKEKRLAMSTCRGLKILARGVMTKKLTVVANEFSVQAVKMITLAGGRAQQIK